MSGVSPTGFSSGASRSDTAKFFSQSENDVAAAFAELLKYEGITPASEPAPPPPPPARESKGSSNESSSSASSDSNASSASAPAPSSASGERSDEDSEREDEESASVASGAQPVPTQQQTQAPAEAASEDASSVEEAELEAILADARSAHQEIDAAGSKQGNEASPEAVASTPDGTTSFAEELIAAAEATTADTAAVEPTAEASPNVKGSSGTEILDPLRHADAPEEEPASEEGFAVEGVANDGGVDEAALAELAAKAAAAAEGAREGKSGDREGKRETDSGEKADAAAGAEAASQSASADRAADASAAVVASVAVSETATSASRSDAAVDAAGATQSVGAAGRHETAGSLQRSIERPSETDRRQLGAADRSRFFDRVERAFKSAEQGDGSIKMRLHPAELGSMQLTLEQSETGEWIARIETDNQEAKQTLLEHAGALKERLADQDFRLARFEVETPADRRQQDSRDFPENPQSFSRGRDRRDDEKAGEDRAGESAPTSAAPGDRSRRLDVTI
ncbi:MAG TPA: flagellar hook-length control protein FliK [Pirellulaceae bacterium]|jgi:flagellar hook-length control protein FliK|nr:flagellar hook-length control protein FliK [Pirellulaceae bacterium]